MKIFVLLIVLLLIMACSTKPTRINSLSIPEEGFQLVQHTHDLKERESNSLYKPSRKIEQHEFGSNGLVNFIKNLRAKMHETHGIGIAANQVNRNLQVFLLEAIKTDRWHEGLDSVPYQVFYQP